MPIFSTIETIMALVNLLVKYEPALEKDVRDILAIVHRIRDGVVEKDPSK